MATRAIQASATIRAKCELHTFGTVVGWPISLGPIKAGPTRTCPRGSWASSTRRRSSARSIIKTPSPSCASASPRWSTGSHG
eukprot:6631225-Alexandrium_andersonii.AAC.1